jgi:hypothetical protein
MATPRVDPEMQLTAASLKHYGTPREYAERLIARDRHALATHEFLVNRRSHFTSPEFLALQTVTRYSSAELIGAGPARATCADSPWSAQHA